MQWSKQDFIDVHGPQLVIPGRLDVPGGHQPLADVVVTGTKSQNERVMIFPVVVVDAYTGRYVPSKSDGFEKSSDTGVTKGP